jgi:signal recognition particle GTPase
MNQKIDNFQETLETEKKIKTQLKKTPNLVKKHISLKNIFKKSMVKQEKSVIVKELETDLLLSDVNEERKSFLPDLKMEKSNVARKEHEKYLFKYIFFFFFEFSLII